MHFLYTRWLKLPLPTRAALATQFGVAKTGPTHVVDNRVVTDGYKIEDLENAITPAAIAEYVGSEADIETLWELMVAKVEGAEITEEPVVEEPVAEVAPEKEVTVEDSMAKPERIRVSMPAPQKKKGKK